MRQRPLFFVSALLALAGVAPAEAAQRFTSPTSTAKTPCTAAAPCAIDAAVNDARDGDEVVVAPGTYKVSTPLAPAYAVDIHGVAGQPRPRLTGATGISGTTLTLQHGESISHLEIRATSNAHSALQIKGAGGRAERLVVWARSSYAAKLVPSAATTLLRDSIVETAGSAGDDAALKLMDGAPGETTQITNVTAIAASGSATAVRCEATKATTAVRNTVARGAGKDIEAGAPCTVDSSNFRADRSPGATGTGNQGGDPRLGSDFYPGAGSPLENAGTTSGSLGTLDLAGRSRSLGGTPDIGAFEREATATTNDPLSAGPLTPADLGAEEPAQQQPAKPEHPEHPPMPIVPPGLLIAQPRGLAELPAGVTPPVLGKTVAVAPASGRVLVKVGARYVPLQAGDDIPVGSTVDATNGSVRLSSALGGTDGFQTGTFSGGKFEVRQPAGQHGMTEVVLRGGDFSKCRKAKRTTTARAAARKKPVRRIWGSDRNGRFRTRGAASIATVRGTRWLTEDRCEGTLTRVLQGAVDVRDLRTGRTARVRAGGQRLVRTR